MLIKQIIVEEQTLDQATLDKVKQAISVYKSSKNADKDAETIASAGGEGKKSFNMELLAQAMDAAIQRKDLIEMIRVFSQGSENTIRNFAVENNLEPLEDWIRNLEGKYLSQIKRQLAKYVDDKYIKTSRVPGVQKSNWPARAVEDPRKFMETVLKAIEG